MTKIKDALKDFNPWWNAEFKVEFKERELYIKLQKFLPLPQIIALTGLRRVGKTTLMLKIAEDSITKGVDPRAVIYFSFDDFKEVEIRSVMAEYEEMMEKSLRKENISSYLMKYKRYMNGKIKLKVFMIHLAGTLK